MTSQDDSGSQCASKSASCAAGAAALRLTVWKLSGAGNDFAALDNRALRLPEGEARRRLVRALCDRAGGFGTDGAMFLEPPTASAAAAAEAGAETPHVRMRYYNRDGSEGEMCGNGARCLALFAWRLGAAPAREMRIETLGGLQRADLIEKGEQVRLRLPGVAAPRAVEGLDAPGWRGAGVFLRVGVPHLVLWIEDGLEALDVETLGRAIRRHARLAPEGANINFVSPLPSASGSALRIRTYERGVECETLACGTGSVAAALAAGHAGRARPPVALRTQSGDTLLVDYRLDPGGEAREIILQGPARMLYRAETLWDASRARLESFDPPLPAVLPE